MPTDYPQRHKTRVIFIFFKVPDLSQGGWTYPWHMDHLDTGSWLVYQIFSSLAWSNVCQEPPILEVHTWRMLKVPSWSLRGLSHLWLHISSWRTEMKLSWKFLINITDFGLEKTNFLCVVNPSAFKILFFHKY